MTYIDLKTMTWRDAEAFGADERALGLLPVAALEQHGPHLPLSTDMLIAEELARRVAEQLVEPVVVAPVFPAGLSDHHVAFPGTVTLPEEVFGGVLLAYVAAFERMGIEDVAIFSAHGGNFDYLEIWLEQAELDPGTTVIVFSNLDRFIEVARDGARRGGLELGATDLHAGGFETSEVLASSPELVRPFDGVDGYVGESDGLIDRLFTEGFHSVTATGVLGDVRGSTAAAGREIYAALTDHLASWIVDELGFTRGGPYTAS